MEGVRLGRYRLVRRVGAGGMAEVWEARMEGPSGFEKRVAVKRILPHLCDDEDLVTMFRDEARLASRLSHAHVAQVFDFAETDEAPFLVMEWIHGRDLRRVLRALADRGEVLGPARTAAVGRAVAAALAHAHGLRDEEGRPLEVVHRDVSPQNVLVSFAGEVKLADFGIAKAARRTSHTGVGVIKGKAAYMSPEQARGEPVDGRSDLFSLGVMLWECLCGRPLFRGDSDLAVMRSIVQPGPPPPPPSSLRADVPAALDAVVERCLRRDPAERFPSARELEHALGDALLELGASSRELDLAPLLRRLFPEEASGRRRQTARLVAVEPELEIDVAGPEDAEWEGVGAGAAGRAPPAPSPREAPTASLSGFRAGRWGARSWAAVPAVLLLALAGGTAWLLWPGVGASGRPALGDSGRPAVGAATDGGVGPGGVQAGDPKAGGEPGSTPAAPSVGAAWDAGLGASADAAPREPAGGPSGGEPAGRAADGVADPEPSAAAEQAVVPQERSAAVRTGASDAAEPTPAAPPRRRPPPARRTESSVGSAGPRVAQAEGPAVPAPAALAPRAGGVGGIASLAQPTRPPPAALPPGTRLALRLTAPAAEGGPVEAALVRSVIVEGRVLLARGARFEGTARAAKERLHITFAGARSPDGESLQFRARVRGEDGAAGVVLDLPHPTGSAAAASLPEGKALVAVVD